MPRPSIAIIGSGISGLGCAYLLHPSYDITVYEKNGTPGGHSRTVDVDTPEGLVPVDTGFIVFNRRNYPLLSALFDHLKVPIAKSDMSFGVSIRTSEQKAWLEYGTSHLFSLFAQKRNLARPAYWHMLSDILRFNREAKRYLDAPPGLSLGACLDEMGLGEWFKRYYLLAMGGAIWSTPLEQMLAFPAASFLRFFENHGLLTVRDQPQWHTVQGGSRSYVTRLTEGFKDRIALNRAVSRITRHDGYVSVTDQYGTETRYDQVILACHADQALALIDNPTPKEHAILKCFRTQPNRAVLHRDPRLMPRNRAAWSSWVYLSEEREDRSPSVSLTYWMNHLQPLATSTPLFVTLNPSREPDPALLYDEHWFAHPQFDAQAITAQASLAQLQGTDRLWFCGAWQRYGFHEDGLASAVTVATALGAPLPWQ